MTTTFKKSSLSEMCKQIKSAPVLFKQTNGNINLAFFNDEDSTKATKLYIMFSDNNIPKYIEGNDIYNLRECIIHNITRQVATELYNSINKTHKESTKSLIESLINKAPSDATFKKNPTPSKHVICNKKHCCGWIEYKGNSVIAFMKDLKDSTALELIVDGKIEYNVSIDCVYWTASISAKEYTDLKIAIKNY